jgi:hypothetical protein
MGVQMPPAPGGMPGRPMSAAPGGVGGMGGMLPPSSPSQMLLDGLRGKEVPSNEFAGRASAPTAVPPGSPSLVPPAPQATFDPLSGRWLPPGQQMMGMPDLLRRRS